MLSPSQTFLISPSTELNPLPRSLKHKQKKEPTKVKKHTHKPPTKTKVETKIYKQKTNKTNI